MIAKTRFGLKGRARNIYLELVMAAPAGFDRVRREA